MRYLGGFICFFLTWAPFLHAQTAPQPDSRWVQESLDFSLSQALSLVQALGPTPAGIPRTAQEGKGILLDQPVDAHGKLGWTTGFFPGTLWQLYGYAKSEQKNLEAQKLFDAARLYTNKLAPAQYVTNDHDVGFVVFSSFGQAYRLTHDLEAKAVLRTAAHSLATRFSPIVGCVRSWDWWGYSDRDFVVIIDNMMNLELLFWSGREEGENSLTQIANSHAQTTLQHHFRPDQSAYHVVNYNKLTGSVQKAENYQGYNDESIWSRGQAWAVYGYTMAYRMTLNPQYRDKALALAQFLYRHPAMPEDKVPYWDFLDPRIPSIQRDASSAAILASALYELSIYTDADTAKELRTWADTSLHTLSSPAFRAQSVGANAGFLLLHSVGSLNPKLMVDIDQPLSYADYYYVEALLRKRALDLGRSPIGE